MNKKHLFFFHIICPLILGVVIYLLSRNSNGVYLNLIAFQIPQITGLPSFVRFNLPDGLWIYALLNSLFLTFDMKWSNGLIVWVGLSILLSTFSEIAQRYKIISGTYDILDLFTYFGATFCFMFFSCIFANKQPEKNEV